MSHSPRIGADAAWKPGKNPIGAVIIRPSYVGSLVIGMERASAGSGNPRVRTEGGNNPEAWAGRLDLIDGSNERTWEARHAYRAALISQLVRVAGERAGFDF